MQMTTEQSQIQFLTNAFFRYLFNFLRPTLYAFLHSLTQKNADHISLLKGHSCPHGHTKEKLRINSNFIPAASTPYSKLTIGSFSFIPCTPSVSSTKL